jgi:hypothetical protein
VTKFVGGFSHGTLVSFTNKTDRHDITEILLKVALNTISLTHWSDCLNFYQQQQKTTVKVFRCHYFNVTVQSTITGFQAGPYFPNFPYFLTAALIFPVLLVKETKVP